MVQGSEVAAITRFRLGLKGNDEMSETPKQYTFSLTDDEYGLILGALFNAASEHGTKGRRKSASEAVKSREKVQEARLMQVWRTMTEQFSSQR